MPAAGLLALLLPSALTALGYVVVGKLALLLAIAPSYAAPIFPSAGIALAATLFYGARAVPGVLLGALVLQLGFGASSDAGGLASLKQVAVSLAIAGGATAQAAGGAWLIARRVGSRALVDPRDVAGFCLYGALVACLVSASVATFTLWLAGMVPADALAITWWTWWAGDTLGVLIGAPIVMTMIGRPRADWAPRRVTLAVPLLAATTLLALATAQVARLDRLRNRAVFEQAAATAADAVEHRLSQAMLALEAARGYLLSDPQPSRAGFHRVVASWLDLPINLYAIGFQERVSRGEVEAFQERVAAIDGRPLRVFERKERGNEPISAGDPDMVVIRLVEPLERNRAALGVNVLSIPAGREAILRATREDRPSASGGFRLTQEVGDQTGVVLYRAVYRGEPDAAERFAAMRGVVFVTLRMEESMSAVLAPRADNLQWCLVDGDPAAPRRRLAGEPGCDAVVPAPDAFIRTIAFGGRQWQLRLTERPGKAANAATGSAWLFSGVGLVSAAMLAALLLTMTGRTRRIEHAVAQRTADLEREVGERTRTEKALRESEERLRNILDHAPLGIVHADLQGRLREANPRFREMVGYPNDAIDRLSLSALTHADDWAGDAEQLALLMRGETDSIGQRKRLLHRDGHVVWVQMYLSVLRDATGQPQHLVAVVEDITEHLRLEDAERRRELAESANRAKTDFLSRMSHELRTPLNAMLGFAQLLELDQQPALARHQSEWAAQIQLAGWHLLDMINDTLDLSRIEAGTLRLEVEPVEIAPLLVQCITMVEPQARARGIQMRTWHDPRGGTALADPTRVKQVLTNLLSNAVKYNVDQGRVDIEQHLTPEGRIEIHVTDTGLGLTPSQLAELFQPFNRLGRERGAIEGTGIGLVISRRLAELMGGGLEAFSQEGLGSTFVLSLPAATALASDAPAAGLDDPLAPPYRQRLVHYVEDNPTNAEVMRGILGQRPQVTLQVTATGLDGLAAIRANLPDLILLDMHLPDIDGLELLRHLKQDDTTADVPVIVVSADATPGRISQAIALGAAHYLTKPLNLGAFLQVLDRLLESVDTRFG